VPFVGTYWNTQMKDTIWMELIFILSSPHVHFPYKFLILSLCTFTSQLQFMASTTIESASPPLSWSPLVVFVYLRQGLAVYLRLGLKSILLILPPKCWNHKHVSTTPSPFSNPTELDESSMWPLFSPTFTCILII
jgi:hypothetical protein